MGALRQDRFTGIMGELGAEAPVIPVHVKVRAYGENGAVVKEKDLNFSVFVQQKWTPFLMSATLSNSLQQMNLYADEMTYRFSGDVLMDGSDNIHVSTMLAPGEFPRPHAHRAGRMVGRQVQSPVPEQRGDAQTEKVSRPSSTCCLRGAWPPIETVWTPNTDVEAGSEIPVKVFLRPYRGDRIERSLTVKIPAGMP